MPPASAIRSYCPFPACAGMNRGSIALAIVIEPVPRMRGDEP